MRSVRPGFFIKAIVISLLVISISGHLIERIFFSYPEDDTVQLYKTRYAPILTLIRSLQPDEYNKIPDIETAFSISIELLPADSVHFSGLEFDPGSTETLTLSNKQNEVYLYGKINAQTIAQIGPLHPEIKHRFFDTLISVGFYVLILIVFVYWLLPLIKNLDKLSLAAENFLQYHILQTVHVEEHSPISPLAKSFNNLVTTINSMLRYQSDMFRTVSHELRTPLSRIKFSLELIEKKAFSAKNLSYLKQIDNDIGSLEKLIDQILRFSKIDYRQEMLRTNRINALPLLKSLQAEVILPNDQYSIEYDIDSLSPSVCINADEPLIKIALSNLIQNALRYGNGKILIQAYSDTRHLTISIEDNGAGLSSDQDSQVYVPFSTIKILPDGSKSYGLGLAISKRILNLHHGNLYHESSTNLGGARFIIVLPLFTPS